MTKINNKKNIHIIAEIGVNHNGNLNLAKKLILESKKHGADSVKFQTYNTDDIIVQNTKKAKYQIINTHDDESQYDMLKKYELSNKNYISLVRYAKKINIEFFSTACDIKSLHYLSKILKLNTIKISSSDLTNTPLLLLAGLTKKNIIISSGMGCLEEVDIALSALAFGYHSSSKKDLLKFSIKKHNNLYLKHKEYLCKKVTLLHCTTDYPASINELNLNVIDIFKKRYNSKIGYSDHSNDLITPIIASSKNIDTIEVHVTIDKKLPGPDHVCSLDMKQFEQYVKNIKKTESILGISKKIPTKSEFKNIKAVRKSLVITQNLNKNEKLSIKNLSVKRPGNGIPSLMYNEYIGKTIKKDLKKNHFLKKDDIKH